MIRKACSCCVLLRPRRNSLQAQRVARVELHKVARCTNPPFWKTVQNAADIMGLASLSLMRRLACTFGGGVVLEFFLHWTPSEPQPALQTQTTLKTFFNSQLLILRAVSTPTVPQEGLGSDHPVLDC